MKSSRRRGIGELHGLSRLRSKAGEYRGLSNYLDYIYIYIYIFFFFVGGGGGAPY